MPTPVSLFVDEKGLDATLDEIKRSPALTAQLGSVAKLLGSGLLDDAIALFRGEAALYVRPLPKGPEYTLVVKVEDEDRANQVLDRLTTLAGAASQALPEHPRIEGVLATKLTVAKTTLYYGVFDGKVVVTTQPSGIRGLVRQGPRLADSPGWQDGGAGGAAPRGDGRHRLRRCPARAAAAADARRCEAARRARAARERDALGVGRRLGRSPSRDPSAVR